MMAMMNRMHDAHREQLGKLWEAQAETHGPLSAARPRMALIMLYEDYVESVTHVTRVESHLELSLQLPWHFGKPLNL